jgi:endo-1,4-beta-xylanase
MLAAGGSVATRLFPVDNNTAEGKRMSAQRPGNAVHVRIDRRSLLLKATAAAVGAMTISCGGTGDSARAATPARLAAAFRDRFLIGVAVSNQTLERQVETDLALIRHEFSSVTAENAMKWGVIRPDGVNWRWELADRLVDFAAANGMHVLGHTLVWHSQVPRQVFSGADGGALTREALLARMEEHIDTLVGRYRGRVHTWDVVNEAIDEDKGWRRSPWFNIIGEDFMEQAFRRARRADPAAKLLYNDYNMHNPGKREFLLKVLRDWLDRGVPIDGVGLQGHLGLTYPDLEEWERSIAAYEALGLEVHVSELDVDVLPSPYETGAEISNRFEYSRENDPWPDGLPDEVQQRLADRYEQIFRILLRHKAVRRVTFWGLHDGVSWKNDFPIRGRTNYPLLFDRNLERKPAWHRLVQLAQQ